MKKVIVYYYYELKIDEVKNGIELSAPAYPELGVLSTGKNFDEAFSYHFKPLVNHWQKLIKNRQRFPKFIPINEINNRDYTNKCYPGLRAEDVCKIMLHHAMLDKGITRAQLANLLAISREERATQGKYGDFTQDLLIKPKATPKYQKVKRLLDLKHPSKLTEITDALQCIDLQVHIKFINRQIKKEKPENLYKVEI